MSGCLPAGQGQMGRLARSLSLPQRCFGDKTDPDLCQQLGKASLAVLCESDKNNTMQAHAVGYALNGSVFPGREGH